MNKNYKDLTIIIVLYNDTGLVLNLLNKIKNFKIIIVDNGKNDKILKEIIIFKNIISIIKNKKNIGYGNAINIAVDQIKTEYFLILNPDLEIDEKSVVRLLEDIKRYNAIGGSPIVVPDKDFYGIFPEKENGISRKFLEKEIFDNLKKTKIEGPCSVDVAKGCVMLFNTNVFNKIGKFDKKFFLFWEEIEICRRIRQNKFSYIISPNSCAFHHQGNSSKQNLITFFIRIFHSELSPLIYFNVNKFSGILFLRSLKYLFRSISYLCILNFYKSFKNIIKFFAVFYYALRK